MSSRFRICLAVLFLALLAGSLSAMACGSSKKSATPTPGVTTAPAATATKAPQATAAATSAPTSTPGAAAKSASVAIKDFEFTPATVTIAVGGTVTWTNNGPSTHTVAADDGSFDRGHLSQGKTFSHTFQTAGTFSYHCGIHPFMKATVIVQ
jgi:plastocyanin